MLYNFSKQLIINQQKQLRVNSRSVSSINLAPYGHSFGPVGRSANSGITATVFGAYGFIGRYIMEELGQIGTRVYVPFRGCELEVRHLKTAFDLGQLGFIPFSSRDKDSIIESVKNSDVVINLIGKHYETKHIVPTRRSNGKLSRINYDFDEVHVTIPQTIAKICAEVGVETFIHVSSLSADLESKSRWSQTKALGEIAVREAFPEAIIVKPATIFGPEDRFLNWFAEVSSRSPFMPILGDGSTLTQPVYSHDVAKAMLNIIYNHTEYEGKTFQLYGPAEYTYKEIAEFVGDITRLKKPLLSIPIPIALKAGSFIENLISPTLTYDMVLQMQENVLPKMMDNKDNNNWLTLKDLNIEPMSMDKVAFEYLHRFRQGGHFTLAEGYH